MDATKRLWVAFQVFVLTGGVYGGTWNRTVEQYVDEIIENLYGKVHDMKLEESPVVMQNVNIFFKRICNSNDHFFIFSWNVCWSWNYIQSHRTMLCQREKKKRI
uniref:Putative secreted protein n=1 Tax=Ixodes ricinus TaxID=34613 RepID=A0A6B0U8A3_IXORI